MFWFAEIFPKRIDVWRSPQSKKTLAESLGNHLKFCSVKPSFAFCRKTSSRVSVNYFPFRVISYQGFMHKIDQVFIAPIKQWKHPDPRSPKRKIPTADLIIARNMKVGFLVSEREISRSSFPELFGVRRERVFQTGSRPERFLLMEHLGLFMEPLWTSWWIIYNIHWKYENNDVLLLVRALHCDFYTKISLMLPVVAVQNILDNIMVRITQENHPSNAT